MREIRNPFHMRASENIESDITFLRLFEPEVLGILQRETVWDKIQIIRSAPGGGKTSLFRIFTPGSLNALYDFRNNDDYRDLYHSIVDLKAINENGPQVLGVMLSCAKNYANLDDLNFDQGKKDRLFCSLLNARIILGALRGSIELKRLRYPEDLGRITIDHPDYKGSVFPNSIEGKDLYDWACKVDKGICETIDSFNPKPDKSIEGRDSLDSLSFLKPETILFEGKPIANRVVVMLDDVHRLTENQRSKLQQILTDIRYPIGIWIAERLEALPPDRLLALGVTSGREYGEPVHLEDYWRTRGKRYEKVVSNIADKRAKSTKEVQIDSFTDFVAGSLEGPEWNNHFTSITNDLSSRINCRIESGRYGNYSAPDSSITSLREKSIYWRKLEILLDRSDRRVQSTLDVGIPRQIEDIDKSDNEIKAAAELFLARDYEIPYYFGVQRIAMLSSANIEQFLDISAEIFEEILSARLLRRNGVIDPIRQDAIINKFAQRRWDEIPRRIPLGRQAQKLLYSIGSYAYDETYRITAPYAPGITGIGISFKNRERLMKQVTRRESSEYKNLARILTACLSQNLLEATEIKQGGQMWLVLYLNRWLCAHFRLPIHYGGWRPKSPDELCKWASSEYKSQTKK